MQTLNVAQAREKLPKIMEDVYMNLNTYIITRRGIPMIKIVKAEKTAKKEAVPKRHNIKKALKLARSVKWVWDDEWKGKTTEEVAKLLAERAWNSHAT